MLAGFPKSSAKVFKPVLEKHVVAKRKYGQPRMIKVLPSSQGSWGQSKFYPFNSNEMGKQWDPLNRKVAHFLGCLDFHDTRSRKATRLAHSAVAVVRTIAHALPLTFFGAGAV